MAFVYTDEKYNGPPISYDRVNANKGWLRHYENYLYLDFLVKRGNRLEKFQAQKELAICERKMAWMEKHRNFDWKEVIPEKTKLERKWK